MQTLVSSMNARGYETVGIHPYYRTGYNRDAVYDALGFDKTYFMDDFEDAEYIHGFISDKSNYEMLIDCFEASEAPFFCFNVTMQNHAGYDDDGGLADKVTADVQGEVKTPLENYLTLLHESDKALEYLISYFETVEEPTVILFVGDHQPMLGKSFYEEQIGKLQDDFSVEDMAQMYEIPYLIWANYPLNMEDAPAETSMNYLSEILFSVAGIERTPWMEMLAEYRREYPIVTSNFMRQGEGSIVPLSVSDTLAEYQKYCYGILWGGGRS
jgi:phosphoglycerol transferase MdoB-like AlkP superfamily enzyme